VRTPVRENDKFVRFVQIDNFIYTVSMTTVSATHAKQNFAAMLDQSQREPVRIQRHERDIAVLVSAEEYDRIRRLRAQELIRLSEETSRYAESQGMTDELLEQLLADDYGRSPTDRWAEFNRLSAIAAKQAKSGGLTEEKVTEIVHEK
jgi:prevent-host-death family protein